MVERFGKFLNIEDSGWFLGIPFVDKIAYIIDVRERAMDIPPQSAITRDNVSVEVSGNLFVLFNDPEKAAYGAFNPLYSVMQVSTTSWSQPISEWYMHFWLTYSQRAWILKYLSINDNIW